jgi:hypothetical protein
MASPTVHDAKLAAMDAARKRAQTDLARKERRDPHFNNQMVIAIVLDRLRKAGILTGVDVIDVDLLRAFDSEEFYIINDVDPYELGQSRVWFGFRRLHLLVCLPIDQVYYGSFYAIFDDIEVTKTV